MKRTLIAVGALLSSALASICCLGPIVLVSLGLGGTALSASVATFRPLFLILTVFLLGVAFYFTYRKKEIPCADGACELSSGSKSMKRVLWIVTSAAIGLATFPYWAAILYK